jgi:hypothetical protein
MTRLMALKLQGKCDSLRITRPDITPTSADLVDELMIADPRKRPQDYGVLIERIDDLIGQQGLSASRRILASTQLSAVRPPVPDPNAVTQPTPREPASRETVEIPDAAPSSRRTSIVLIAALLLAIIGGGAVAIQWLNAPGKPDLETFGTPISLPYIQNSFETWKQISGSWGNLRNSEDEPVLQGKGVIRRDFSELATAEDNQLRNYRLQVFAELNKADAVEVHVGFAERDKSQTPSPEQRRVVLRMTPQGAQLGHKLTDEKGWRPSSPLVPLGSNKGGKHSLVLERHTKGWRALLDGDTTVGFVNAVPRPEAHELRLVVEGGEAWFSDIELMELRKPEPAQSK